MTSKLSFKWESELLFLRVHFIVISLLLFSSCATLKNPQLQAQLDNDNCNQNKAYDYKASELPRPIHEIEIDTVLASHFSSKSLNIGNAIGVLPILEEYLTKKKDFIQFPSIEKRLELIELKERINSEINLASLEISAVASEIDCEEEKTDQIVTFIRSKADNMESNLTVTSIAVGATAGIVAGSLELSGKEGKGLTLIGISTGVIEGVLGLVIIFNEKKMYVQHARNILKDVWEGPETSRYFPSSVWYYLNYYNPVGQHVSLRKQIVNQWLAFPVIAELNEKKREVLIGTYFGQGGVYTSDQLKIRTNMYDQLESSIKVMKQELKDLLLEFETL